MRDIVGGILKGNYIHFSGALNFSVTRVEIEVSCDCDYEGSFKVFTSEGGAMQGYVLSTDMRMEVLTKEIAGVEDSISYHFHGDLCKPGDEIKGAFEFISDHGEYSIPFIVKIEPGELTSSMGPIRNLFNFVNLAKSNWNEALDLFYSDRFRSIFCGTDEYFNGLYSVLSASHGNQQNLEEFLLCTGKKSRVQYFYEKKVFETGIIGVEYSEKLVEREIEILRSGWGYTDIDIEIDGDFILTRREELKEEDFVGNICTLKIFIDTEKCLRGRREGKIVLRNNFTRLEIPVVVRGRSEAFIQKKVHSRTLLLEQITREYIRHGLGLMDDKEWFESTSGYVEQLSALSGDDVYVKLFKARLLTIDGRSNEAGWLVDQAAEIIEHEEREGKLSGEKLLEAYAYHWLIAAHVKDDREFTKLAANKVESLYKRVPENWKIAVIALMLPTTNNANTYTRWTTLEKLFETGSRSGTIYFKGIQVLNENPMVAKKIDGFFIQTVYFGAKLGVIGNRCLEQVIALSQRTRNYSYVHIHMLELLYEQFGDKRILQELCAGLIVSNRTDKNAHVWYRKAIENEIKLTNLFEYFIRSLDLEEEEDIPVVVLMYFGYRNNLASEQLAYFYYYLIKHKAEYEELYLANISSMEFFANDQIARGNVDKHLAYIYSEILNPELLSRQQAIGIADIIFSRWVVCDTKECEKAVVYQKGCVRPFEYPLKGGAGAISVYGSGNIVAFEDRNGNRYVESVKYTSEELMSVGKYLTAVTELVWDNERLNLYVVGTGKSSVTVTGANISRFMQLGESELIRDEVRQRMLVSALEYYSIHDDNDSVERILRQIDVNLLTGEQMGTMFPILNKFGHEDIAEGWLIHFGPYFISRGNLKRFLERKIKELRDSGRIDEDTEYRKVIVAAAIYVYREGNAGSVITEFLSEYYDGLSKELAEIWRSLKNYNISGEIIVKRIILQHLFSGAYLPGFIDIAAECFELDPTCDISKATLAQGSYSYLLGNSNVGTNIISHARTLYELGEEVPHSSKLSYLKYYAENFDKIDEKNGEIILSFLRDEIGERCYLSFFKKYLAPGAFKTEEQKKRSEGILEEIADRTIIDYVTPKGKIAKIHYVIVSDGTESYDYAAENMRDVCSGVCSKDFILFFGESLQYYITEETKDKDEAELVSNGQITGNNTGGENGGSKYSMINEMIVSNTTKDYQRFDDLLEEYNKREYLNGELFKLV